MFYRNIRTYTLGTSRGPLRSAEHNLGTNGLKETSHKDPSNIKKAGT
jgi:hypothetical protein